MSSWGKKVFATAGATSLFMGSGRPEFDPKKPRPFTDYLYESVTETLKEADSVAPDEGIISNFMAPCFIHQANLSGFLPAVCPALLHKPCTAVEGACGSGGRAIWTAIKTILSGSTDVVLVVGFEIQNSVKALYGADFLAGADDYAQRRKEGYAYYFPGVFSDRAGAYYEAYGMETARTGMAYWYQQAILNARKNRKAQEHANRVDNLLARGMTPPNPKAFVPHLNAADCSKVSDGAASLLICSEEGLKQVGEAAQDAVELLSCSALQGDITKDPEALTSLTTTGEAAKQALEAAQITTKELALLELHDCFSITALLALEALQIVTPGEAAAFIESGETAVEGSLPTNPSGGLVGFGHPTGATGIRQLVDIQRQSCGKAENPVTMRTPYSLMISMGGNDKTVTALVTQASA